MGVNKIDADVTVMSIDEFADNVAMDGARDTILCSFDNPGCRNLTEICEHIPDKDSGSLRYLNKWNECQERKVSKIKTTGITQEIQVRQRTLPTNLGSGTGVNARSVYEILEYDVITQAC